MAIILSYVPPKREKERGGERGPASIIFFPGVRYDWSAKTAMSAVPRKTSSKTSTEPPVSNR
jgi:hypothetical protein